MDIAEVRGFSTWFWVLSPLLACVVWLLVACVTPGTLTL